MVDEWILFERLSVWKFIILFYFDDKSFELLLSFCYLKMWVIDYTFIKKIGMESIYTNTNLY